MALASYGVAQTLDHFQSKSVNNSLQTAGLEALSASQLEKVVTKNKLVAYWVGPESGFLYLLDSSNFGQVTVKYVPSLPAGIEGRTTRRTLREVVTFAQENAFEIVQNQATGPTCNNFINADGNSVHTDSAVPTIIYIGIKNKPIQVLLFDPDTRRNLSFACVKDGIRQIGQP
jgi:hypothetical protein